MPASCLQAKTVKTISLFTNILHDRRQESLLRSHLHVRKCNYGLRIMCTARRYQNASEQKTQVNDAQLVRRVESASSI